MKRKTLDKLFWFIIYLLPVFCWFVVSWRNAQPQDIVSYLNTFGFPWIQNVFDTLFSYFDDFAFPLTGYLSYLVAVEVAHCGFDIIVFIPRFCHQLCDVFISRKGD